MRSRRSARDAAPVSASDTTNAPLLTTADGAPLEPPADRTYWSYLNRPFTVGFFVTFGGLVAFALGMAITNLVTIWIYIAFALFAALGLDPLVSRLERHRVSRAWGIVIVYAVFTVLMVGVLWLIIPTVVSQVAQFVRDLPQMISTFQHSDAYAWITERFGDQAGALLAQLQQFISDPANIAAIGGGVFQVGATIASSISGLIIIIVLSLYFLASLDQIKQAFYRLWPARSRTFVSGMTDEITGSVGSYLGGMVVLAFFNSVMTFILYTVLHLPFPLLMAVVAFCLTIIPLVGTVMFWVVGCLVALFASPLGALVFAVLYLVYMQVEAYVLTPKVMNKAISVPGSLVVIGALVGGTLMGLLGALVAIPVTASILLIIKKVYIPRQDAKG
ncbi:AI-2E family transporter [Microbacterium dextranolyticum]|uniref:AI-2E family transporter n=1 Tax=Microbacterium dextranolyticum TaxID=36806 RepID=A0A9W6HLU5_9MICO|nr:AI-2E family transporter [Microbacterium dextranolyticum]MBM7461563.1 putative PurR-regulated permease PerM [Microbacterium dextranolyticum]GLJ94794.1 AI-2E family transporter [Microbacterium dextranolyticum]